MQSSSLLVRMTDMVTHLRMQAAVCSQHLFLEAYLPLAFLFAQHLQSTPQFIFLKTSNCCFQFQGQGLVLERQPAPTTLPFTMTVMHGLMSHSIQSSPLGPQCQTLITWCWHRELGQQRGRRVGMIESWSWQICMETSIKPKLL